MNSIMDSEEYPTLKSLCEGRELPAYDAVSEFTEQMISKLDELLEAAGGDKNALNVLNKLERQIERLSENISQSIENGDSDTKILAIAARNDRSCAMVRFASRGQTQAVELIENYSFRDADVVFLTDGECAIGEEFAAWFQEKKRQLNFTVKGIVMDACSPGQPFSLTPFCEKIYRMSEMSCNDAAAGVINSLL